MSHEPRSYVDKHTCILWQRLIPSDIFRLNTMAVQDYCGVVMKPREGRESSVSMGESVTGTRTLIDLEIN